MGRISPKTPVVSELCNLKPLTERGTFTAAFCVKANQAGKLEQRAHMFLARWATLRQSDPFNFAFFYLNSAVVVHHHGFDQPATSCCCMGNTQRCEMIVTVKPHEQEKRNKNDHISLKMTLTSFCFHFIRLDQQFSLAETIIWIRYCACFWGGERRCEARRRQEKPERTKNKENAQNIQAAAVMMCSKGQSKALFKQPHPPQTQPNSRMLE